MASVVVFITIYFFSHELRLTTFSLLVLIQPTEHLLLGSNLLTEYLNRVLLTGLLVLENLRIGL